MVIDLPGSLDHSGSHPSYDDRFEALASSWESSHTNGFTGIRGGWPRRRRGAGRRRTIKESEVAMSCRRLGSDLTLLTILALGMNTHIGADESLPHPEKRPGIAIRGIYGGVPKPLMTVAGSVAPSGTSVVAVHDGVRAVVLPVDVEYPLTCPPDPASGTMT